MIYRSWPISIILLASLVLFGACEIKVSCDDKPSAAELHNQGIALMMKKKPAQAAKKFRQVISMAPADPRPYVSYCQALAQTEDTQRAFAACHKALEMAPGDVEVLYHLASLYVFSDQHEKAREFAEKAIAKAPEEAKHHSLLGVIDMQARDPARAIAALKKGANLDPQNSSTHRNLAIALALCARCKEAGIEMQAAVRLGDDGQAISGAIENNCKKMIAGRSGEKAFLIDRRAVSGLEYSACVDEGACPKVPYGKFNRQPDYAEEPAMSIDFAAARAYCEHVGKRLPTAAEYRVVWQRLEWHGCCARGVIPREWTSDPGKRKGTAIQARKSRKGFEVKQTRKRRGVDSSTVRCAKDLPTNCRPTKEPEQPG